MDAKAILKALCDRASKIAKRNGFDIDVASDLQLKVHYDLPESKDPRHALIFWWLVSKNDLRSYNLRSYEVDIGIKYPINKFFDGNVFQENIFHDSIPDATYETILKSLTTDGVVISFKRPIYAKAKLEYDNALLDLHCRIEKLKANDEKWATSALAFDMKRELYEIEDKMSINNPDVWFTFQFAPKGANSLEEAKIWCDVNC